MLSLILALQLQSFAQDPAQALANAKKYFSTVSPAARMQVVGVMDPYVGDQKMKGKSPKEILNYRCAQIPGYQYNSGRPEIKCDYLPKKDFGGMTQKFQCKLGDKKFKVKYLNEKGGGDKEIPQGTILPLLAQSMGFNAPTFCPARVVCQGCSRDPWSKQKRSSAAAAGETNTFPYALIEIKSAGLDVTISKPKDPKRPQNFLWTEIESVKPGLKNTENRRSLILWNSLVGATDSDPHNQELKCHAWKPSGDGFECQRATVFSSDFGDSFFMMDLGKWRKTAPLKADCTYNIQFETLDKKVKATNASIQKLVQKLSLLKEEYVRSAFEIAEISLVDSDTTAAEWAGVFMKKVDALKQVRCLQ